MRWIYKKVESNTCTESKTKVCQSVATQALNEDARQLGRTYLPFRQQCGGKSWGQTFGGTPRRGLQDSFRAGPWPWRGTFCHPQSSHRRQSAGMEQRSCLAAYESACSPRKAWCDAASSQLFPTVKAMARGHSSNELSKIIRLSNNKGNQNGQHLIEWIRPLISIIVLSNISWAP